jgi:hypothetical protein
VGLAGRGVGAEAGSGGPDGPGDGQSDEGGQQVQLGRVGQAGVLDVQATGLGLPKSVSMARRLREVASALWPARCGPLGWWR